MCLIGNTEDTMVASLEPIRMTVSEALTETLVAEGVTTVTGIVGSAFMDALDLFPRAGIRFVSVAHEQNAAHMADGYARASGGVGVVVAQNGPGVTNFVTAVAAAYWAHTPMVVLTPSAASAGTGLGGFQETDQLPIFSKITRWQAQVNRPDRIAELVRRAFSIARQEHGPVQIDIPRDYFFEEISTVIRPASRIAAASANSEQLEAAATLLVNAKFPVLIAGGGVVQGGGTNSVVELAEFLTAPVVTSYLHNDAFPFDHPLACGPLGYQGSKAAMSIIKQADVVLALGTRLGPFGTLPQYGMNYWPDDASLIQVDTDHRVIGLTKVPTIGIAADAHGTAVALLETLRRGSGSPERHEDRIQRVATEKAAWADELGALSARFGEPISPRRALSLVSEALPEGTMVSTDIGNICSVANSYLRFRSPRQFFAAMSFGNCGYAYPTALGAQLAVPSAPVVAFVGDGAWGMSLAEVMTAVREQIPVVAIVWNNHEWGAEKRNQIDYYDNRFVGSDLVNPDFAEIATAMGAVGIRVTTEADIQPAVSTAINGRRPTVINLEVDPEELGEPFRRDALKKPNRLLSKYQNLKFPDGSAR
jgi:sulfoacetaldehyde acetyltransferase